ncbi:NUDIX hydrolase [Thalassococcus sp. S3]|uniref:NUDIX hydrolase n=1 Tax=Thalassococcus sp. S3 TaxID=2017482 RepID=UPI001024120E|nr:NUDIX hydrolase [Thalassococcus sp. S3]QBF30386.1 DNA mismatch repair protein MutT [Thalassococcus sp. S3]
MTFSGAKLALFVGSDLLVILRDEKPDIPYPGYWDLPGGGREGGESPQDCALRETREEVGLIVPPDALIWERSYLRPLGRMWFFAARMPASIQSQVRFGNEGQCWRLMAPDAYLAHPKAIPQFATQLRLYLQDKADKS